jgi:hypothetical protein
VGIHLGHEPVVLDIDIDLEASEDGFDTIGFMGLLIPASFEQVIPSGGMHIFLSGKAWGNTESS